MTDQDQLERLINAAHPCIAIATVEEEYARSLAVQCAVERNCNLWVWSVTKGVHDGLIAGGTPLPDTEHPAAALYHFANQLNAGLVVMLDLAPHLKDERTMRALREAIQAFADAKRTIILIDYNDALPPSLGSIVTRMQIGFPAEDELADLVKSTLRQCHDEQRITVNLSKGDLQMIVRNLRGLSRRQACQIVRDCVSADRKFDASDINEVLSDKRKALQYDGLLDYVEAPVDLTSIGGLNLLKAWLERRAKALTDEAIKFGIEQPRGVLMLGVQGAGKSLAAKAVATAWQRPLLRMDVGALYDKFIGESERRLRDALRQAESMSPIVLWIDEIEKAFASAASQSSDGGLSRRMFGSLLTWMQERTAPVFLIATANDIEALPPELLRKGRFDEIFFVDLPTPEARKQIFEIHLKKRSRDPATFDMPKLVAASDGYSGAEIEQGIIAALFDAFAAKSELKTEHIEEALKKSPPLSVTMAERIEQLREWAQGRCVPAD